MHPQSIPLPPPEWVVARVDIQPDGCWIARSRRRRPNGYVRWSISYGDGWQRHLSAHQWAYLIFVGPIPAGYHIDHRCHPDDGSCPGGAACPHRACCNPAHLAAVTPRENAMRSTAPSAVNARRTQCAHGHPFDGENTLFDADGHRQCRACARLWDLRRATEPALIAARKVRQRRTYARDREAILRRRQAYREANREAIRAANRARYAALPPEQRAAKALRDAARRRQRTLDRTVTPPPHPRSPAP